jgi:hypothetical protein
MNQKIMHCRWFEKNPVFFQRNQLFQNFSLFSHGNKSMRGIFLVMIIAAWSAVARGEAGETGRWEFNNSIRDETSGKKADILGTKRAENRLHYIDAPGGKSSALLFDGNRQGLTLNGAKEITFSENGKDKPFSVELLFKTDRPAAINKTENGKAISLLSKPGELFIGWNNAFRIQLFSEGSRNCMGARAGVDMKLGKWTHVIVTYDGSGKAEGINIYQDGRWLGTIPESYSKYTGIKNTGSPLRLGFHSGKSSLKGAVDKVIIYDHALDRQSALINSGAAKRSANLEKAPKPGWVMNYLSRKRPQWHKWQNSLKPAGKSVTVKLAQNGATDYLIVIPAHPTLFERRAASELQLWLGRISGAEFPIVSDERAPQAHELSVGNTNRVTTAVRQQADKIGKDAYVIAADNERLLALGAGNTGALYAALALLEEDLGVRWYAAPPMTGKNWPERTKDMLDSLAVFPWGTPGAYYYPKQSDLTVQVAPRGVKPPVSIRFLHPPRYASMPWGIRNRINAGWACDYEQYDFASGLMSHTFHRLVPPKKYFKEHPEYYSLLKGKRVWKRAQLCMSNPEVAKVAAQTAIEALKKSPAHTQIVSVAPMDWGGYCECRQCQELERQLGSRSGLVMLFVSRVAKLVKQQVPDAVITTYSYWDTNLPPAKTAEKVPDNVVLRYCMDWGGNFSWPYHSMYDDKLTNVSGRSKFKFVSWSQRENYERWKKIVPRMSGFIYPSQYNNTFAPMPNIRALAENLRFFEEQHEEFISIHMGGSDIARQPMRNWVLVKLLWNPDLNVEELLLDFIFGYYGDAAAEVLKYNELLWDYAARYLDFSKERDWVYPVHEEEMFQHGFIQKARAILDRALDKAENDDIRRRVKELQLGVVFVEYIQLYSQMHSGLTPPDQKHYIAVAKEFRQLVDELKAGPVNFYDGSRKFETAGEFIAEMDKARIKRFENRYLPDSKWGSWKFRWDPRDRGIVEKWFSPDLKEDAAWQTVKVPAFLAQTPAGNAVGYGWYRGTFELSRDQAKQALELEFGGVDEQAWIYVNGKKVGEHSLESEFIPGQDISAATLWRKPFTVKVGPETLKAGRNLLAVRIHNSEKNAGIHRPVQIYFPNKETPIK